MAHREAGTRKAPAVATDYQRARDQESFWRNRAEAHEAQGELRQAAAARGRQAVVREKVAAAQRITAVPPPGVTSPPVKETPRAMAQADKTLDAIKKRSQEIAKLRKLAGEADRKADFTFNKLQRSRHEQRAVKYRRKMESLERENQKERDRLAAATPQPVKE